MCLDAARIECNGALTARDRGSEIALLGQHASEIAVSGGVIGPQDDGSAITGAGIGEPARCAQGVAEIGMTLREVGDGGECLADQLDRTIRIAPF